MTDPHTQEQAALYVLDMLEGVELQAFERKLSDSPELRDLVRQLSSGLFAPARHAEGPTRMDILDRIHQSLGSAPSRSVPAESTSRPERRTGFPWTTVWAAAACLMLLLNVLLLSLGRRSGAGEGSLPDSVQGLHPIDRDQGVPASVPPSDPEILQARIRGLEADLVDRETRLVEVRRDNEELLRKNREVREFNEDWRREFTRLAARIMPFFESNDRMSRFTVIELVDSTSLNDPGAGIGFADLAGRFLTGEANIALGDQNGFMGPTAPGEEPEPAVSSSLAAVARDNSSLLDAGDAAGEPDSIGDASPPPEDLDQAMGFTVWRDDEQKGFLDLYNLPETASGQPFLWVRSSELEPYLPVGYIPGLENGNGSFFYSVDEPGFTPTDILITAENGDPSTSQPSGQVLLKGP